MSLTQQPAWARPLLFCFPFVLLCTACVSAGAGRSALGQASDSEMAAAPAISADSYLPPASSRTAGLSDIVLIYQGGTDRLPWTPEQFAPYISARTSDGREHWLFDGFLFIEFRDNRGHEYMAGSGAEPARQEDWLWLIERNFAPGKSVPALDQALNSAARRLGEPARPRQVILTIPQPLPTLTDWGSLNGRSIDFRRSEDRVAACRWHIETALARWDALHPVHLKLAGFYWVAESSALDAAILPQVAEIVHALSASSGLPTGSHLERETGHGSASTPPTSSRTTSSIRRSRISGSTRSACPREILWDNLVPSCFSMEDGCTLAVSPDDYRCGLGASGIRRVDQGISRRLASRHTSTTDVVEQPMESL